MNKNDKKNLKNKKPVLKKNIISKKSVYQNKQKRPIKLGTSGGNGSDLLRNSNCCSAGTLGCLIQNTKNKRKYILSNSHVFVGHEPSIKNNNMKTRVNDKIIQPGSLDFKKTCNKSRIEPNKIAKLKKWTKLSPKSNSNMDLAVAKIGINKVSKNGDILNIGKPINTTAKNAILPEVNMEVQKSGRTTGKTTGKISVINATVSVEYDSCFPDKNPFTKKFTNTFFIIKKGFSAAGDSGSLVLNKNKYPVGLLFAGGGNTTVCLGIKQVLQKIDKMFKVRNGTFRILGKSRLSSNKHNFKNIQNKIKKNKIIKAYSTQKKYENTLLKKPGVLGIGIKNDFKNPKIIVITSYNNKNIPTKVNNIPIECICIGSKIKAF